MSTFRSPGAEGRRTVPVRLWICSSATTTSYGRTPMRTSTGSPQAHPVGGRHVVDNLDSQGRRRQRSPEEAGLAPERPGEPIQRVEERS
jgi:hypothetical protein